MAQLKLPNEFRAEAENLASLPYAVVVIRDTDSEGKPVFVARNLELDGCMADGSTSEEAIENLKDARADYIQVLLLSGEKVPLPEMAIDHTEDVIFHDVIDVRSRVKHAVAMPQEGEGALATYTFELAHQQYA